MQKLVESCLAEVNQEMQEAEKEYRDRVLVEMGIVERVYADDIDINNIGGDFTSREYPYLDEEAGRWYALIPVKVTDEEWKCIRNAYEWRNRNSPADAAQKNAIINLLKIGSVIVYIGGLVLGIFLGINRAGMEEYLYYIDTSFSLSSALICWAVSFIAGTLMLGFSEIIELLRKGGYGHAYRY